MKKTLMGMALLAIPVLAGFGQEARQTKFLVGFYAETWALLANGFGSNIRYGPDHSGYLDFAVTFCPNTWEDRSALFAMHLSMLFKLGKKNGRGLLIGPGISFSPSLTIPVVHLKAVILFPLGNSSGVELGAYPILASIAYPYFVPLPNFHVGYYFRP